MLVRNNYDLKGNTTIETIITFHNDFKLTRQNPCQGLCTLRGSYN